MNFNILKIPLEFCFYRTVYLRKSLTTHTFKFFMEESCKSLDAQVVANVGILLSMEQNAKIFFLLIGYFSWNLQAQKVSCDIITLKDIVTKSIKEKCELVLVLEIVQLQVTQMQTLGGIQFLVLLLKRFLRKKINFTFLSSFYSTLFNIKVSVYMYYKRCVLQDMR